MTGEQVEHVVEEAHARTPLSFPGAVERERQLDVRLLGATDDLGPAFRHRGIVLDAGLHRLGVHGEPLGTRDRRSARASRRAQPAPAWPPGGRSARTAPRRTGRRRPSAGRGWSRRRSPRTPSRTPRRRTRSRRGARGASISASGPMSCRCSGRSPPRRPARPPGWPRGPRSRVLDGGRHGRGEIEDGVSPTTRLSGRARPEHACRAPPAPDRRLGEDDGELAGAGERVDAHDARELPLGLLHPHVPGPGDHVHPRDAVGAQREGGHGLCAAHPVDLLHTAQRAGRQHRGIDVAVLARRGADHDLIHAGRLGGHGAHHDRTGVGRAPLRARRSRPARPGSPGP